MYSDLTWRKRKQERDLREFVSDTARYVDLGVELCTVVADPNGKQLIVGSPRLKVIDRHYNGGILDRHGGCMYPSQRRRTWYASIAQTDVILHPDSSPLGQLIVGSERGGKTEVLPMWHFWRWLENINEGRVGGQTAPTMARLEVFMSAFVARWDPSWYRYRASKRLIQLCDGSGIRLISTHRQSESQGSPLQGFGFSWGAMDEAQDSIGRFDDMESRGASAREVNGVSRFKQARTATSKDRSDWRDTRDRLLASGMWEKRTLLGVESPFIPASFWEQKRSVMSPREYERRVMANDVGIELAVYYGWQRNDNAHRLGNLVAIPRIATDVTAAVLAPYQRHNARFGIVVCHDPGNIYNTSIVLRLLMFSDVPTWVVVGELQTEQTTARQHASKLHQYIRTTFYVDQSYRAAVFVDPHGKGEAQTDFQTVYLAMQLEGLDVMSPAPITGKIKRSARVEMVNRLLTDATGSIRLVVACDHQRNPVAPRLVDAFESLQKKPGDDNPEGTQRKDVADKTHAPAALAYGLWPFEQEAYSANTVSLARAEAKRSGV